MDDPVGQGPSQLGWLAGPLYWLAGLAGWLGWLGPLLGPLLDPFLGRFNRVFLRFGVQKGVKMGSPASPGPDWPEPVRTAQNRPNPIGEMVVLQPGLSGPAPDRYWRKGPDLSREERGS